MEETIFRLKTFAFVFLHVQHMHVGLGENSFLLVEQPGQMRLGISQPRGLVVSLRTGLQ